MSVCAWQNERAVPGVGTRARLGARCRLGLDERQGIGERRQVTQAVAVVLHVRGEVGGRHGVPEVVLLAHPFAGTCPGLVEVLYLGAGLRPPAGLLPATVGTVPAQWDVDFAEVDRGTLEHELGVAAIDTRS